MKNFIMSAALIIVSGCASQKTASYTEFQDFARQTELNAKATGQTTAVYKVSHGSVRCDFEAQVCKNRNGVEICVESTACVARTD